MNQNDTCCVLEQTQKLLNLLNIDSKPDKIFQLNSAFFIKILETICFDKMKNTIKTASCLDDEIFNYNLVLSALQNDILGENIDHISAECLVRFDSRNIRNLVEIFSCLGELVICEVGSNAFPPAKFDFKEVKFCEHASSPNNNNLDAKTTLTAPVISPSSILLEKSKSSQSFIQLGNISSPKCFPNDDLKNATKPTPKFLEFDKCQQNINLKTENQIKTILKGLFEDELNIEKIPSNILKNMSSVVLDKVKLYNSLKSHRKQLKIVQNRKVSDLKLRNAKKFEFVKADMEDRQRMQKIKLENERNQKRAKNYYRIDTVHAKNLIKQQKTFAKQRKIISDDKIQQILSDKFQSKAREMLEEIIDNHKRELEKDKNAHSKNIEVITKIFEKTLNEATKIKEECSAAEIAENTQNKYKKIEEKKFESKARRHQKRISEARHNKLKAQIENCQISLEIRGGKMRKTIISKLE